MSGALPIDIQIALPDNVNVSEIGDVTVLLRDQVSRFQSFNLRVRIHNELEVFIISIGEGRPAPFLEHLVLKVQSCTLFDTVIGFTSLPTAFTPSLHLAHIELPAAPLPKSFPHLATITSFTIDNMHFDSKSAVNPPINEILTFLSSTLSLQHFVYKGCQERLHNMMRNFDYPHIVLPNLLTVDITAPGAGTDLFRFIDAPALTDARIILAENFEGRSTNIRSATVVSTTVRNLSTGSKNLRRLTLENTEFILPLAHYELLFFSNEGFRQLEEVLLIATDITDKALVLMSHRGRSSLKRLELRDCEGITGTGILEFMQSRSDFFLSLQGCRNLNMTQEDMASISAKIEVTGLQ